MNWFRVSATDSVARSLADRHYPRENVGARFFTPPGRKVVLRCADVSGAAYWVSLFQQHVDHAWPGAWVCSAFRNETGWWSSELILEALAATRAEWGEPPPEGMITFVDPAATARRRGRNNRPGHCFRVAGFVELPQRTTRGYFVLHRSPAGWPPAVVAPRLQAALALEGAA